jgi:hypothetical protein
MSSANKKSTFAMCLAIGNHILAHPRANRLGFDTQQSRCLVNIKEDDLEQPCDICSLQPIL